jgi:Uncharacterized protein containing a NRPS condensation (elongation) domain
MSIKVEEVNGRNISVHQSKDIDTSKCIRKVANLERLFLWSPECTVSMITRIKGDISKERLRRAIFEVAQMHPLVGEKIVFDKDYNAWFSNDGVPEPNLKVVSRFSDKQWFEELQKEIQIPFNLEEGPMIKFILIYSENISDLIIMCNHSICDGMSLANLVRDLFNRYTNPEQEIKVIYPPNIMDLLPIDGFSLTSILFKLIVYRADKKWKKSPYYFNQSDCKAIQTEFWKNKQIGKVLLELEPHETKYLSKQCKKNGVTMGSAVTAAFIAAHEDIGGPFEKSKKQVSIPFDLRRHAKTPVEDVFCFCVGASRFSFKYNSKKSFWKNALSLHKEIHKRVVKLDTNGLKLPNYDPTLLDAVSCFGLFKDTFPDAYTKTENLKKFSQDTENVAFSFAKIYDSKVPGTIPSNLGKLSIHETYGDLKIDRMIFLPSIGDSVPLTIGGISIGDRSVFSLNYTEPKSGNNAVTVEKIQIRNRALEYLGFSGKVNENALV